MDNRENAWKCWWTKVGRRVPRRIRTRLFDKQIEKQMDRITLSIHLLNRRYRCKGWKSRKGGRPGDNSGFCQNPEGAGGSILFGQNHQGASCLGFYLRMLESYKRFAKIWIHFANPWICTVSNCALRNKSGFISYRGSQILNDFKRFVLWIRFIDWFFKDLTCFHESNESSQILTNP